MAASDLHTQQGMVIQDDKPDRRPWLWGCGGCSLLICAVLGILGFLYLFSANESYPLQGEVSFPPTVKQSDNFEFVITLTNPTADPVLIKHFTLQKYVGLPSLLDAVRVMSVEPNMESEPIVENELQFPYFQEIKSGEALTVIFRMQAENIGTYYIDVVAYASHPFLADPAFRIAFWFGPAEIKITP